MIHAILRELRFILNMLRVQYYGSCFIDTVEGHETFSHTGVKSDVLWSMRRTLQMEKNEVASWSPHHVDMRKEAIRYVRYGAYNLVSTNRYQMHLRKDVLQIHKEAIRWGQEQGMYDEDFVQEEIERLAYCSTYH